MFFWSEELIKLIFCTKFIYIFKTDSFFFFIWCIVRAPECYSADLIIIFLHYVYCQRRLLLSADNLCKHFGTRSGQKNVFKLNMSSYPKPCGYRTFKCMGNISFETNTMNPDQIAPLGSSLIWVHIVCNI